MRHRNWPIFGTIIIAAFTLNFCVTSAIAAAELSLTKADFGKTRDGQSAELYTLSNTKGLVAKITNFGAIIVELDVPDKAGKTANVIQGFANVKEYETRGGVNGATIGRYANRIANAKFKIDGKEYTVTKNGGANHIHGGRKAFHQVIWKAEEIRSDKSVGVKLTYHSADGEEGFPGNLDTTVTYTLPADANELRVEYAATTDKPTVVNLTNHGYFNLAGANSSRIDNNVLTINADQYAVAIDLIPTGELKPVKGTPLDFTSPAAIGPRLKDVKNQFDNSFVINGGGKKEPVLAARLEEPTSGRVMELWTTQPSVVFYTGNNRAVCLEPELLPDSPNRPEFPTPVLRPGEKYSQTSVYRFSTTENH
ncbi:MAG TPA: aldose epimerase family protein [Tepidisphaeraceae bacterium]|jgi:aldose 1-epimerase